MNLITAKSSRRDEKHTKPRKRRTEDLKIRIFIKDNITGPGDQMVIVMNRVTRPCFQSALGEKAKPQRTSQLLPGG
ncbi:hypothetical protein BJY01DRAFT_204348 [Aspergillus pseudoustus]|uniref:MADS-box domain-containing protein n=1 Tax=Aspergillus pseudoustus TaxID=1810923 RepID=A0ABR4KTC5_9EURO